MFSGTIFGIRGTWSGYVGSPNVSYTATNILIRSSSAGSEGGHHYYWVRYANNINMSNYTALWIDNTGVGCALWKGDLPSDGAWYGQWTGYFIKVGVRGPGGPLYIEWESVSGWMVVTKSELTSNGLMNGNYIKGISVWSSSNHNTYPSTQPTLKYGFS